MTLRPGDRVICKQGASSRTATVVTVSYPLQKEQEPLVGFRPVAEPTVLVRFADGAESILVLGEIELASANANSGTPA